MSLAAHFDATAGTAQAELFDFLRIPSVSARSEHDADTRRCAEWLRGAVARAGLEASVHETPGHPIVLGEWRGAPGAPTLLVYGHYDVQPAEPLELWDSPAFEPAVRDGRIYARGSVDDKGQLFLHVKALEAVLATTGTLPVNVVLLAEGEEEVGSDHLEAWVEAHKDRLACDAVVISDSAMFAPGIPSILSSLRGLAYFQIDVQGPAGDLHSGSYGGAVVNPAMALARVLATLHDADGRVAIPGFYDAVRAWPEPVRAQMRGLPFDEGHFRAEVGAPALGGEAGYSVLERLWTRPTCEVNGLLSGYTGEGAKTVLPARAMAKVSCRLVPDQDPAEVERLVAAHVAAAAPAGVTVTVRHLHGGRPWRAELEGPLFEAAKRALAAEFGREPVVTGEGGSIPVVGDFARILGAPVLLVGFGLPGENAHAPNEWMSVENFEKGMRAMARLYAEYGAGAAAGPADPWALVAPDGSVAVQGLPAGAPPAGDVRSARDADGALRVYVDGVSVPVAHARTLDNDAVTFAAADGVAWTAFHADGTDAGAGWPDDAPSGWRSGLFFNADGRPARFHACERPRRASRPGVRLRDQITDAELRDALAASRPRRSDDA